MINENEFAIVRKKFLEWRLKELVEDFGLESTILMLGDLALDFSNTIEDQNSIECKKIEGIGKHILNYKY